MEHKKSFVISWLSVISQIFSAKYFELRVDLPNEIHLFLRCNLMGDPGICRPLEFLMCNTMYIEAIAVT